MLLPMKTPTTAELRAFVERDFALAESAKARYWAERKATRGVAEAIAAADELRKQAQAARPDWPSDADRAEDLACHQRVAELLARAGKRAR